MSHLTGGTQHRASPVGRSVTGRWYGGCTVPSAGRTPVGWLGPFHPSSRLRPSPSRRARGPQEAPCSPRSPGRSGRPTCARSCCSRWASSCCSGWARTSGPGVELHGRPDLPGRGRREQRPLRPGQHVQRWRAAPADDLRARDHAVHHREHHPAAARRGDPAPGGPQEGGPGRHREDHPVHPLPDGRRWPCCRRTGLVATARSGALFPGCPVPNQIVPEPARSSPRSPWSSRMTAGTA